MDEEGLHRSQGDRADGRRRRYWRGAVEMLPSLTAPAPKALAATGTAGITHKQPLDPQLIQLEVGSLRSHAPSDATAEMSGITTMNTGNKGSDASVRLQTCSEAARGIRPPRSRFPSLTV
jgi:hypothetical protein